MIGYMTATSISRSRNSLNALLVLLIMLALYIAVIIMTSAETEYKDQAERLMGFDFSSQIAVVSPNAFERHPGVLYTPEDFAGGTASAPSAGNNDGAYIATYRLILTLAPGTIYGISGFSATHAMTLWIDGEIAETAGVVANNPDNMIPSRVYFTTYFEASQIPTEIVIQRSGFDGVLHGELFYVFISEGRNITEMNTLNYIRTNIAIGSMMTASLIFLGFFIFFKDRLYFLWFSLACFAVALRSVVMDYKLIHFLVPQISWQWDYKISHLSTVGFLAFMILFVDSMFRENSELSKQPQSRLGINRYLKWFSLAHIVAFTFMIILTDVTVYFSIALYYNILTVITTTAILFNMTWIIIRNRKRQQVEYILVLIASVANVFLGAGDIFFGRFVIIHYGVNLVLIGSLVFAAINTIALTTYFKNTKIEFDVQQLKNIEAEETNKMLTRLGALKTNFLADISHEMKSPLYTMSGYAELTERQITAGTVTEDTKKNLRVITEEAGRLSKLVERLLEVSVAKEEAGHPVSVAVEDIVSRAFALCAPMLATKQNSLDVSIQKGCPPIAANPDMVLQVFYNILGNAGRHCSNAVIKLNAEVKVGDDHVTFTVEDQGTGIPPEIFAKVFERGITGDGSSGLGLSICKEAIEAYGGSIKIESEVGKGTSVSFTLPIYNENKIRQEATP